MTAIYTCEYSCDWCRAISTGLSNGQLPPGWAEVRLEAPTNLSPRRTNGCLGSSQITKHACAECWQKMEVGAK
jgi:hypothetical protein